MEKDNNYREIKNPTTFSEQVELYKSRNLKIDNIELAENTLKRINYYRLRGYTLTLMNPQNHEMFANGSTFDQLLSLYEFDRKLRHLFMTYLESIEIAFRTHITYHIAHLYGPLGYKNKEVFINENLHKNFIIELERALLKGKNSELFIKHYYEKYNANFPIWVAIEVTSFGTLSKLYKNLKPEIKQVVGRNYYNVPYSYLESWLQTLSNVRNVCAHYGRLYNKNLTFKPRLFKEERKNIDNNTLFAAIYISIRLLTSV